MGVDFPARKDVPILGTAVATAVATAMAMAMAVATAVPTAVGFSRTGRPSPAPVD